MTPAIPAAGEFAGPLPVPADNRAGQSLAWEFPGHGDPTLRCGRETKVGHRKVDGRWCLWDEIYRCPASECPVCFNQPGGYASREAEAISARLDAYFEMRNALASRAPLRRRAIRKDRLAELLLSRASEGREWDPPSARLRERARRLLVVAERDRGRSRVRRPIHVVVCPPEERWGEIAEAGADRKLRAEMYEQARMRGVDGACAIFHHTRLRSSRWDANASLFEPDDLDVPHLGPHWHLIGDGWVSPRGPLHERSHELSVEIRGRSLSFLGALRALERPLPRSSRAFQARVLALSLPPFNHLAATVAGARPEARAEWVVSNKGVRVSVYQTAFYCLTHAGFARRAGNLPPPEIGFSARNDGSGSPRRNRAPVETVTWFGTLAPRTFPRPREPVGPHICARCGEEIGPRDATPVAYLACGPPPKGDVDGDPGDWRAEGLTAPTSKDELSERLARHLRTGSWKYRAPRGLERWEMETANAEADEEWSRGEWDRVEASVYEQHGTRPRSRREIRAAFNEAMREERWST
ncbi:MAG: hypothetical protein WB786_08685 [Thermoplasmata archaeon]